MAPSGSSILSTEQQIQSIWSLGGLTKRQFATKVWNGINDDNLLGRASELAYNFILAIFPMLLFLLALFGLLGYTLVAQQTNGGLGQIVEIGKDKKKRWSIDGLNYAFDMQVLRGDRILNRAGH